MVEALNDDFHAAVKELNGLLNGRRKQRFVEFYTALLVFYASDPLSESVPLLFRHGDIEARRIFTNFIEHFLRGMTEVQQKELWDRWLKTYWINRLSGVPSPLEAGEIEGMVEWLVHLPATFKEAVALAEEMPQVPLQHCNVIHELKDNLLIEKFPESVARLLIYLGGSKSPGYIWHGAKDVIAKLNQCALPEIINIRLAELTARLGI